MSVTRLLGLFLGAVAATVALLPASAQAGLVDPHPVTPQIVTPQVITAPAPSATLAPAPSAAPVSVPSSTPLPKTPAPTFSPSPARQSVNADVARRGAPEQVAMVLPPGKDDLNRLRAVETADWEEEQTLLETIYRLVTIFAGMDERQVSVPETIANDIGVERAAELIGKDPDSLVVIPGSQPVGPYQQAEIDAEGALSSGSPPPEIEDPPQSEQ